MSFFDDTSVVMRWTDAVQRHPRMLGCAMTKPKTPFDVLEKLRDALPPGNQGAEAHQNNSQAELAEKKSGKVGVARAVVRIERKGRRGKEATVIEKLDLRPDELERWCRELKQALGCGGSVDGEAIVLQGDLRPRLAAILSARGVSRITIA